MYGGVSQPVLNWSTGDSQFSYFGDIANTNLIRYHSNMSRPKTEIVGAD